MTEPTVTTKGSNSDSVRNTRNGFLLPELELRHPANLLPLESEPEWKDSSYGYG
ncbi:MAG: hypothetical protein LLF95_02570 [Bacteroidales bacterium]|nr:hypothetical protein [Bacteroidales bacterium]